jgi:hypothetical protein
MTTPQTFEVAINYAQEQKTWIQASTYLYVNFKSQISPDKKIYCAYTTCPLFA